jgi:phosphatidylinositol kinase/protein kinase (PI-3  family)
MVIFKDGDDVRQDQLCLQMFKIMMEKWEENDLVIPMVRREKSKTETTPTSRPLHIAPEY